MMSVSGYFHYGNGRPRGPKRPTRVEGDPAQAPPPPVIVLCGQCDTAYDQRTERDAPKVDEGPCRPCLRLREAA